ncbi:MAG: D-sedoheptulose-7-phosphate isomerase [Candidatus Nitrospinota bacterium M3_3B_026]
MEDDITRGLKASADLKLAMIGRGDAETIAAIARMIVETLKEGGKLILAGNGGSAADAQHMASELVGRYLKDRPPLAAIALTTDTSAITAISNDYGFEKVFSRQLEALGMAGDVFLAISTSGQSANLVDALATAGKLGLKRVCLLGGAGGEMKDHADIALIVPSSETPRIQEAHITIAHLVCEAVEAAAGEGR